MIISPYSSRPSSWPGSSRTPANDQPVAGKGVSVGVAVLAGVAVGPGVAVAVGVEGGNVGKVTLVAETVGTEGSVSVAAI